MINTLLTGPLFAPLMFVLIINTAITRELDKADKPLPVPVIGAEHAPNLIAALKQSGVEIKDAPADPERAVREQDADLVLRIPADYADGLAQGRAGAGRADLRPLADTMRKARWRACAALLDGYAQRNGALRLLARGIDAERAMRPLVVADRDQSTAQARSGTLFGMLPYFFILGVFIGGMALAIDTTAGERERQSLEPLLVNPVRAGRILLGKLGATTRVRADHACCSASSRSRSPASSCRPKSSA